MITYALLVATALASAQPPDIAVGQPALLFVLPAINEEVALDVVNRPSVALSDFTGVRAPHPANAVVLHFFDRDHGGDALADLNHLQRRYANKGVQVIAISTDQGDLGGLSTWITDARLSYPVLRDNHSVVTGRYGIEDLPMTLIVDANGDVFAIGQPMGDNLDNAIASELEPLVRK